MVQLYHVTRTTKTTIRSSYIDKIQPFRLFMSNNQHKAFGSVSLEWSAAAWAITGM